MTSLPDHGILDQPPVFFDATPSSLKSDAERIIAATVATWDAIVSQVQTQDATFENCIMPILQDENTRSQEQRVCECASAADYSPA
jgi:metallopeptidase MepB